MASVAAIYRASKKKRTSTGSPSGSRAHRPRSSSTRCATRRSRRTRSRSCRRSIAAGACAMFALLPGWTVAGRRRRGVRVLVRPRLRRRHARAPAQDRVAARPPARLPDGRAQGDAAVRLRHGAAVARDRRRAPPARRHRRPGSASPPGIVADLVHAAARVRRASRRPRTASPPRSASRKGPIGMALNALEWAARDRRSLPAVHLDLRAREPDRHLLLGVRRGERALLRARRSRRSSSGSGRFTMTTPIRTTRILIAAGRGKRLGAHTEEIPKCMVRGRRRSRSSAGCGRRCRRSASRSSS